MTLLINFPTRHTTADLENLRSAHTDEATVGAATGPIIFMPNQSALEGHAEAEDGSTSVFLSGYLTNVPSPFRAGNGISAARSLVSLYSVRGTDAFAAIDGAFCAIIVDRKSNKIVLARDKLGIARVYLKRNASSIVFSNSLAALIKASNSEVELDIDSVYSFLSIGWIPTPHSMVRGVEKVPPGTFLQSGDGTLSQTTYYDVPHTAKSLEQRSPADLKKQVTEHLDRSIDRGLSLGGRWGSFLSGGVDSSSVVASLGRNLPRGFPTYFGGFSAQLNRYLPNPEEPAMSELVASKYHADHHMLWLGPEAVETAAEIVAALEEPVCDGGCIIVGEVMRAAVGRADGLMTGVAGDFLFTGERRHMVLNLLSFMRVVPNAIWRWVNWTLGLPPFKYSTRISQAQFDLTRLLEVRKLSLPDMYAGFYRQASRNELDLLILPNVKKTIQRDPQTEMNEFFKLAEGTDPLSAFLYLDLKTQSTEHCVREVEMLGRHFGLNVYNPFLDAEFVDFAMTIPASDKVSGLQLKKPLKDAMRGRVPDQILDRKKGGLGSPIRWWVTQPDGYVSKVLSRENMLRRGLFSPDVIERFRRETATGAHDYTKLLWSLFTLELWQQHFMDGSP